MVGPEIEGEHVMRSVPGEVLEVFVTARELHGRTLSDIVDCMGDAAHGVFLRSLTRHDQEVPITPQTRIYVGDVMTLVGLSQDLNRVVPRVGQPIRAGDRTDIAFLATGLAVGLLGWPAEHDRWLNSANPRRRWRRIGRWAGMRMVALAPAHHGGIPAGGAAISDRPRAREDLSLPSAWRMGLPRWPPYRPMD